MKKIYLFDGQGAFKPGIGKKLYYQYPAAQEIFEKASEIVGISIKEYCFGKEVVETAQRNDLVQLSITTTNLAYAYAMKSFGFIPDLCLGHSLGEMSALIFSGILSLEEGMMLVRKRGFLMDAAGKHLNGDLLAVKNNSSLDLEKILNDNFSESTLCLANINSPEQIVISGKNKDLQELAQYLAQIGVLSKKLNVGGPWHNKLLENVRRKLEDFCKNLHFNEPDIPFYSVTLQSAQFSLRSVKDSISNQLVKPVEWSSAIQGLYNTENVIFYEVGPGKILKGLIKQINPDAQCLAVCQASKLEDLIS